MKNRVLSIWNQLADRKVQTARPVRERVGLLDKDHGKISMRRQCELLRVAHFTVDYEPVPAYPAGLLVSRARSLKSGGSLPVDTGAEGAVTCTVPVQNAYDVVLFEY